MKLAHAIGRVLKGVKIRAGWWATFGTGVTIPFVAPLPAGGSRAPTSVSRGSRDHIVVAASSTHKVSAAQTMCALSCGFLRLLLLSWRAADE